jgi:transcriptional regulator GlxA family with amidase domain
MKFSLKNDMTIESTDTEGKALLDTLCQWMLGRLHEPLSWTRLTEESGINHTELYRLFMLHYKTSPMQWIRLQRESEIRLKQQNQFALTQANINSLGLVQMINNEQTSVTS